MYLLSEQWRLQHVPVTDSVQHWTAAADSYRLEDAECFGQVAATAYS